MTTPGPARLPYPHSRNDCNGCGERDADCEYREGNPPDRPARLCRTCAGDLLAWWLLRQGTPVTFHPLTDDARAFGPDLITP